MKRNLLLSMALVMSLGLWAQGEKNFIDQNYVEIYGYHKIKATADVIHISFTINEKDFKNKKITVASQEDNVVKALEKMGINIKTQLQVDDMESSLKKYLLGNRDIKLSRSYTLKVANAATAARAFMVLEQQEVNDANISTTEISNINELRNQVKVAAIKDAKIRAQAMASELGQSVGRAIYIQDVERNYPASNYERRMMLKSSSAAMDATVNEDIEFQSTDIESYVMVRFELK